MEINFMVNKKLKLALCSINYPIKHLAMKTYGGVDA
jgi:hypothetical protein